ncbi:DUF6710 family protein [Burkholderia vietnamiensis]|uniref:DUF6710 family protein n=1 Tax=Burkholderia vietnamiensis TaxID=60552 RepID=UPI003D15F45A
MTPSPQRVPIPNNLPPNGPLKRNDRWASMTWAIDSAAAHGKEALRSLAIAYGRILQARQLESLICDAREHRSGSLRSVDLLWESDPDKPSLNDDALLPPQPSLLRGAWNTAIVLPSPWEPYRLFRSLENLWSGGRWGTWRQSDNHVFIAWQPWPIVWVENGNHSTISAILKGDGEFSCQSRDATPLLNAVRTDGSEWFHVQSGKAFATVDCLEMAAIFEIGRRLVAMSR